MPTSKRLLSVALGCLASIPVSVPGWSQSVYQKQLEQTVDHVLQQDLSAGIDRARQLTEQQPQFKLAHLLYADLLRLQAGQQPNGNHSANDYLASAPEELRQEFRARLYRPDNFDPAQHLPAEVLHLDGDYKHIMVADLKRTRLYVYGNRNGQLHYLTSYFLGMGKKGTGKESTGDLKTPLGIYYLNRFISEQELPDLYGLGAFTMNYPNYWDQRQGRSGSGIWLHGTAFETYSRGPYSSEGCLTLTNDTFRAVADYIELGRTPIIVGDPVHWVKQPQDNTLVKDFRRAFDRWLSSSRQNKPITAAYTADFLASAQQTLPPRQPGQAIQIDQLSLLKHPQEDLVLATFSDKTNRIRRHTRQYWQKQAGQWKIIYEGTVQPPGSARGEIALKDLLARQPQSSERIARAE